MEFSFETVGASLAESGGNSGELETNGLSHGDNGPLEVQDNTAEVESREMLEPHAEFVSANLFGLSDEDAGYSPSVCTDFSGFLPDSSWDQSGDVSSDYSPETMEQSTWESLAAETVKLPWELGFWDKFRDPNTSVMDMLGKGFKRPVPAPVLKETSSASSVEIERRVFPRPFKEVKGFLQHVRDIPERSWQEEREAMWETSVRRWVALTDTWIPESSNLIAALHNCTTFKEKAQILVDVFYNKFPQTLMKRVNSLQKLCTALREDGIRFPCGEEPFYNFGNRRQPKGPRRRG